MTRTAALDLTDLVASKAWLIERGNTFAATSLKARAKIAELGECFIRDGSVVMTHGNSRVVLALLKRAAAQGKHFSVVVRCPRAPVHCAAVLMHFLSGRPAAQVTEGRPDSTGPHTARMLVDAGVPVRALPTAQQ